jgi:hypothetical protein
MSMGEIDLKMKSLKPVKLSTKSRSWVLVLIPIILATQKAEIRRVGI